MLGVQPIIYYVTDPRPKSFKCKIRINAFSFISICITTNYSAISLLAKRQINACSKNNQDDIIHQHQNSTGVKHVNVCTQSTIL